MAHQPTVFRGTAGKGRESNRPETGLERVPGKAMGVASAGGGRQVSGSGRQEKGNIEALSVC